jgi:heme/copper-type cytochrome/quinol oxidase subunit 1
MAGRSRTEALGWVVAGVLVLVGMTALVVGALTPVSFGWFAYAPLSGATFMPGNAGALVSWATIAGSIVLALGLIALAFLAGRTMRRRGPG